MADAEEEAIRLANREARIQNPFPLDIFEGVCECHPFSCEAKADCMDCFTSLLADTIQTY